MRGSPLSRALIALAVLLALGLPLRRLLRADDGGAPPPEIPAAVEAKRPVHLQITFTTVPARFSVKSLGETVWNSDAPTAEMEHDLSIAFPKEGIELEVSADWPGESRQAAQVRLTGPDGQDYTRYLWGQGSTTDVLPFP